MQGIGVRYTENGARALALEKTDEGIRITGLAASSGSVNLAEFLKDSGLITDGIPVACGLCPGDFLSVYVAPDESIEMSEVKDYLLWDIERKMVSEPSDYIVDFAIADRGFAFAARKNLVSARRKGLRNFVTDVEPVALLNGCETAGEIGQNSVILISIEGEGISSVYLNRGELLALESFPVKEEDLAKVTSGLDSEGIAAVGESVASRLAEYVSESITRLKNQGNNELDEIILCGGGLYTGKIPDMLKDKIGLNVKVSDPLKQMPDEQRESHSELLEKTAAFTTCYGLAARALEI